MLKQVTCLITLTVLICNGYMSIDDIMNDTEEDSDEVSYLDALISPIKSLYRDIRWL